MSEAYRAAAEELSQVIHERVETGSPRAVMARDEDGKDAGAIVLFPGGSFATVGAKQNDRFEATGTGLIQTTHFDAPLEASIKSDGSMRFVNTGERPPKIVKYFGSGRDAVGFLELATQRIRASRIPD